MADATGKMFSRADLKSCKRVLVKVGTTVVTTPEGRMALGRVGAVVEQLATLHQQGYQVILVTSGAIGLGRQRLYQQQVLSAPLRHHITEREFQKTVGEREAAASGQSALMAHYSSFFAEFSICCSQVLLTEEDFQNEARRANLRKTMLALLDLGVIPVVNENDVVTLRSTPTRDSEGFVFWDNDSLALLIGVVTSTDAIVLMTDVPGLYEKPPEADERRGASDREVISVYRPGLVSFSVGGKSREGRGGMQAKIESALGAVSRGVRAVVIASGYRKNALIRIMAGEDEGTLFCQNPAPDVTSSTRKQAEAARRAGRALAAAPDAERRRALELIAERLVSGAPALLAANRADVEAAKASGMEPALLARLGLTETKLRTLAEGIAALAAAPDPIGRRLRRTTLADGLELAQESVPLGVVLVVFESRPDALPQICALALRSGNALLLKGGSEAQRSNAALHAVVVGALEEATGGRVGRDAVVLVDSRNDVDQLLRMHEHIDLVIPRGSTRLVRHVQSTTKIPVLGHAEGICHVYVDKDASVDKAVRVVLDSKTDYPAACNAMETLLIHDDLMKSGAASKIVGALRSAGVRLGGDALLRRELGLEFEPDSYRREYGDMTAAVVRVRGVEDAVAHILEHGSGHTDAVVTENKAVADYFLSRVDSGCVFHNASTRFADGYRMGLGAEVGISTSKIHARGPVGVEGLTSTRWVVVSHDPAGHTAGDFAGAKPRAKYVHRSMPLDSKL